MNDVVGQVVVAISDEDLLAGDAVMLAPSLVFLWHSARAQGTEIGAGLRLGQVHRAGPFARHELREIDLLLFGRTVRGQHVDRTGAEQRAQRPAHARRIQHLDNRGGEGGRQPLPAMFGIDGEPHPATLDILPVGFAKAGGRPDDPVFENAAGAVAALRLLTVGARGQPVPDCGQAKTAADKAICGNVELAAADKAMADSYTVLRAKLPPEQQRALLADQRRWITRRTAACGDKSDDALAQCMRAETEARRRFLAGESANGARDAPRIVPILFHEARKGRYEISIETPQMLTPRGSAATAFEQAARAIAFGKNAVKEYREMDRPMAK